MGMITEVEGRVAGYKVLPGPVVAYRVGLAAADAVDVTDGANLALPKAPHGGFKSLGVAVRFSTALPNATVLVYCVRYASDDTLLSVSEALFTSGLLRDAAAGLFFAEQSVLFDTNGAAYSRVLIALPSAGTVDLYAEPV